MKLKVASTAEPLAAFLLVEDLFLQLSNIERRWIGIRRILAEKEDPKMDNTTIIIIVAALIAVAAIVAAGWMYLQKKQSGRLRSRFGSEYDRLAEVEGGRRRAERLFTNAKSGWRDSTWSPCLPKIAIDSRGRGNRSRPDLWMIPEPLWLMPTAW